MNLVRDKWIPIRRKSGKTEQIAPWQVTHSSDPPISLAAPRPDFNGALIQFLIGLFQTAAAPKNHDEWVKWLEDPPREEILKERLVKVEKAFDLDGDGPKFMQDIDELESETNGIGSLLIDAPGANTLRHNKDHFVKRGMSERMCHSCVATAIFALQTNAPSGGQGHRVALRGGGPMTTLVVLDPDGSRLDDNLWRRVWLNVLEEKKVSSIDIGKEEEIFPWLAKTRTSEKKTGRITTPEDVNLLQMYWGMPRRIRIEWNSSTSGLCDVCGKNQEHNFDTYRTVNLGINYEGAWQHTLSPHIIDKKSGAPIPIHVQPGGISYRNWPGIINGMENIRPAAIVSEFSGMSGRKLEKEQLRVWAFGYDMDNMKARCWYDATMPLITTSGETRDKFVSRSNTMVEVASEIARIAVSCIKEAWFRRPGDVKGDTSFIRESFFNKTENIFFELLSELNAAIENDIEKELLKTWHSELQRTAQKLFDSYAGHGNIHESDPERISLAYRKLMSMVRGRKLLGKLGIGKKGGEK